jgi:hypothetical protein
LTVVTEDNNLTSKVAELMTTLDEVKKYREIARSLVDFALIMFASIVAILFVYIGTDLLEGAAGPLPASIITLNVGGIVLSDAQGLSAFSIFIVAFLGGILWVDRRVRRVKTREWKESLQKDGTFGSMKILSSLDWSSVFSDIRYSKIGFVFYSILKVVGYWILTFIILFFVTETGLSFLHVQLDFAYTSIFSLILALVLSRKDLQRRYNQSWALDSLLWELRWFDSEFRGKAAEIGTTTAKA